MRARVLLLAVTMISLAGCGSSPPVRFYTLEPMPAALQSVEDGTIVGIGPLSFPDYLKRPQIVTRTSSSELDVAEFDRWAEPLEAAFKRTLAANVDALLADALVIEFPFGGGRVAPDYRIMAQVARFDVGADRVALLDVRWGIGTGAGESLVSPRRSVYRADVSGAGYQATVAALADALEAFSRDIAVTFQEAR